MQEKLLHLGCGLITPEGWVNVDGSRNAWLAQRPMLRKLATTAGVLPRQSSDVQWAENVVYANVSQHLPFKDAMFDAVYSSHLVEHLYRGEALTMLREAVRVLKPGGICRTLVPDLEGIVQRYLDRRDRERAGEDIDAAGAFCEDLYMVHAEPPPRSMVKQLAYGGRNPHMHQLLYDGPSLIRLMNEAGFEGCQRKAFRDSFIPRIEEVEMSNRFEEGIGVAVEGRKPGG